jgi:two-component system, NarL family, capsular synthesis sensor histidine kinase RcsC
MQKILDRTQASLADAFASLARNAKRQQYLYLTACVTLMAIVVFSALLLGVLAASKQLDYRRSLVTQFAADISAVSSPPVSAALERELRMAAANLPDGAYRYTRHGAILRELIMPGFGSLVGYLPWGVLIATMGWQLGAIAGVALCLLLGIALTARFWGLRLLRTTHDETARALENEAIHHVLVSATPIGLCIVRQSDYSITANALAGELLRVELSVCVKHCRYLSGVAFHPATFVHAAD